MINTTLKSNFQYGIQIKLISNISKPKLIKTPIQKEHKNIYNHHYKIIPRASSENKTQQISNEDNSIIEKELKETTNNNIPQSDTWELDFCSRPMVDERNKKVWELLICDPKCNFKHYEYFANNRINSTELRMALESILAREGAVRPKKIKFFRSQMKTIISRAVKEMDIIVVPSRRCFALMGWLTERMDKFYPNEKGYTPESTNFFSLDLGPVEELPDQFRGEAWDFVQLPLKTLLNEIEDIKNDIIFGQGLDLEITGISDLSEDTIIPGISVYSRRAEPLAAWTNGIELVRISADTERCCLILESGCNERWKYASYSRNDQSRAMAKAWEMTKLKSKGLHFLTVQENPELAACNGLWLMVEINSYKL